MARQVFHIVLLKYKDSATHEPLMAALGQLKALLPKMTAFTHGAYASSEGANDGFTHAFTMTFADAESRDVYLDHPEHVKVKETFLPRVEKVIAFDYEG